MGKYKRLAAKAGYELWYNKHLKMWALTHPDNQHDTHYFTKELLMQLKFPEVFVSVYLT